MDSNHDNEENSRLSDGTGNSSASPHKTNVWRAYQLLDRRPGSNQVAFYDNGVGTSSFTPLAIMGLAFGLGVARNVKQIYGFLCRTYNPGDEIYAFGFSRGAFTIRVVVALVAQQGIIDRTRAADKKDLDRLIAAAYHRFRRETFTPSLLSFFFRPVRDCLLRICHRMRGLSPYNPSKNIVRPCAVKFVGVWDTVDAYGLPIDELTRAWDRVVWPLTAKDRDLSNQVDRARQALSLDEQRESFEPMLWNENSTPKRHHINNERLAQVWFPGVHANVGGGYPDDALALVPLLWILEESQKRAGLKYLSNGYKTLRQQAAAHGLAHDSRKGYGVFYRYAPRNIERLNKENKPGLANWLKGAANAIVRTMRVSVPFSKVHTNAVRVKKPVIHHTVFDRILEGSDAYAPINIPADYAVLMGNGSIVDARHTGYETVRQAKDRRRTQSWLWNKVLARKLLEFLQTVVGPLALFVRAIPDVVGRIPGLGFVGGWARQYSDYALEFLAFVAVIGMLLFWSWRTRAGIQAGMRTNWRHLGNAAAVVNTVVSAVRRRMASWREGCGRRINRVVRFVVEAVAVLVLSFLVLSTGSRIVFAFAEGLGCICYPRLDVVSPGLGKDFTFVPRDLCFDTGLVLKRGRVYEIDFRISKGWRDKKINADVTGWIDPPWGIYGSTPLRRYLFVDWYEPVARIGADRFDTYPLTIYRQDTATGGERLVARFSARRSGRLYLYMNDAVLFTWDKFYRNNRGKATVKVREVTHAGL